MKKVDSNERCILLLGASEAGGATQKIMPLKSQDASSAAGPHSSSNRLRGHFKMHLPASAAEVELEFYLKSPPIANLENFTRLYNAPAIHNMKNYIPLSFQVQLCFELYILT
ncbi:hypothetical protein Salat_0324100 [Sesamum alatum]|uniref:Uncharacterized protein n=1 Tax=Sesamum alatum TaxID=300844 RepID=A0AAE2CZ15_9LAMI|nr:hypothetical protein Salat_0324100 [Sesamum alatum]